MKDAAFLLTLVLLLILPTACSEDEAVESLISAKRTDDDLTRYDIPLDHLDDLEFKLETNIKLQKKVEEIRNIATNATSQEFELLMELGKRILRDLGENPDVAFGRPDDPHLAMVPGIYEYLVNENDRLIEDEGKFIIGIELIPAKKASKQVSYGRTISLTQDSKFMDAFEECMGSRGATWSFITSGVYGFGYTVGITGKVLIATTTAFGSLTVGGVIIAAGAMYGAYRVGTCVREKERKPDCSLTTKVDINCLEVVMSGGGIYKECYYEDASARRAGACSSIYSDCVRMLDQLAVDKMALLQDEFGDTLELAVQEPKLKF